MRLFVALDIDESIQQKLDDYVRTLQIRLHGVRFVNSSNYHITLKFLGEVPSPKPVIERLGTVLAGRFEIRLAEVGFFPNSRAPRVFWAGIHSPEIAGLARSVNKSLESLGFPSEREFSPHLTLARSGSGRPRPFHGERPSAVFAQIPHIVSSSPTPEFGTMTAREFFLYESKLSPAGASYRKLERFALDG